MTPGVAYLRPPTTPRPQIRWMDDALCAGRSDFTELPRPRTTRSVRVGLPRENRMRRVCSRGAARVGGARRGGGGRVWGVEAPADQTTAEAAPPPAGGVVSTDTAQSLALLVLAVALLIHYFRGH